MGTRSLTHFKRDSIDSPTLMTMYRQYDGNPSGHGKDMVDFLSKKEVYNGYPLHAFHDFNGMGDVAAQTVAHLKTWHYPLTEAEALDGSFFTTENRMVNPRYGEPRIGNVYIVEPDSTDQGEEYVYTVYLDDAEKQIFIKVEDAYQNTVLFQGSVYDASQNDLFER